MAGNRWYGKSYFCERITDDTVAALVRRVAPLSSPMTLVSYEPLGGAVSRIPADATAFPHRDARFVFGIYTGWTDPEEDERHVHWTRELFDAMQPFGSGVYVNYLGEEDERIPSAYGRNYQRLAEIKARWDPDNLFRMNQNVPPLAGPS